MSSYPWRPFIPLRFAFRWYRRGTQVLYGLSLFIGLGVGILLAPFGWGRVTLALLAWISPVTVILLHVLGWLLMGRAGYIPEPTLLNNLGMHIAAGLTMVYTFSGFVLTGLGLAWLLIDIHGAFGSPGGLISIVFALYALWVVPYVMDFFWK